MKSKSKAIAKVVAFIVLAGICCAELPMISCFGARFSPGDEISLPPLPPSDTIMGFFSKFKAGDNLGNIYQLKDLPIMDPGASIRNSPEQPSVVAYNGRFLLYFVLKTEDNNNGISAAVKVAQMEAASPYIDTGPNGIAESGLGGDDFQIQPVGTTGLTPLDVVVTDGGDAVLQTGAAGDDVVSGLDILAGANGIAESGRAAGDIQGVVTPAISIDALSKSENIQYYSVNGIPVAQGESNRLAVSPGADGIVQTPCFSDDNLVRDKSYSVGILTLIQNGIYSGIDGITQSGLGLTDIQMVRANTLVPPRSLLIRPGPSGILQARPKGGIDTQVIPAGTFTNDSSAVVIGPGPTGLLETCPAGDDYVMLNPITGKAQNVIFAGNNEIADTTVIGDDMYAAMDGGNGVSDSGLGGDDYQLVSANDLLFTGVVMPVVSSGANNVLETPLSGNEVTAIYHLEWFPAGSSLAASCAVGSSTCAIAESGLGGDDTQAFVGGTTGLGPTVVVVGGGGDTTLQTEAGGDDVIAGSDIQAGPNGISESGVWGDDIQVVRRGSASLLYPVLDLNPIDGTDDTEMLFPVIIPGPDGVLQTPSAAGDNLVIMKYTTNNTLTSNLISTYFGVGPLTPPDLPNDITDLVASGLGGRGLFDATPIVGCAATYDNGTTIDVGNPFIGNPAPSECKPRLGFCSDDCQERPRGSAVGALDSIILAGHNQVFDTPLLVDDGATLAIADGGNGLAESGLGGDDVQVIPVGQGLPNAMEITAGPHADGSPRVLGTAPLGDDLIVTPQGVPELSGDGIFTQDNPYTLTNPDGDKFIENWATVDDGEYFSWKDTNVNNAFLPSFYGNPATGNLVDDVQAIPMGSGCGGLGAITAGPNGVLETAPQEGDVIDPTGTEVLCGSNDVADTLVDYRGVLSFHPLLNPVSGAQLLAYTSNGRGIYLTRSVDGVNWDPPQLVLTPGGTGRAGDPVVLAGVDGICETIAQGDDFQAIPLGRGQPNTIVISAGPNKKIDSLARGDDYLEGLTIRSGANGIRETPIVGDDWEIVPTGKAQPDGPCVLAGANRRRDTDDFAGTAGVGVGGTLCPTIGATAIARHCSSDLAGAIVGDDRAPFVERNLWKLGPPYHPTHPPFEPRNSATYDPTCNPVTQITYGSTCPWLPEQNEAATRVGDWAGFDAMGISDPFVFAFDGLYYMYYTGTGAEVEPETTRPLVTDFEALGPCPRAGLNGWMDTKVNMYASTNADNNSNVLVTNRIGVATSVDGVNWVKVNEPVIPPSNVCGSGTDITILTSILGSGLPLPSLLPGSSRFDYGGVSTPFVVPGRNYDGSPIFAMLYTGLFDSYDSFSFMGSDHALFTGTGTSIGLARSFDGIHWLKMDAQNPVFIGSLLGSPETEGLGTLQGLSDSYILYYQGRSVTGRVYIALARRFGAVYPSCLSVARTPFESVANNAATTCFIVLLLIPAMILVARRIYKKRRS